MLTPGMPKYKYGDLVISLQHIPSAQGPYLVLHEINDGTLICVALDNSHSINILKNRVKPFPVSLEVLLLVKGTP